MRLAGLRHFQETGEQWPMAVIVRVRAPRPQEQRVTLRFPAHRDHRFRISVTGFSDLA